MYTITIIYFSVKSYDGGDIVQTEVWEVGFRSVKGISIVNFALGMGTTECNKLFRNEPIKISILNFFIMLIFVTIKIIEVKITSLLGYCNSIQAIKNGNSIH